MNLSFKLLTGFLVVVLAVSGFLIYFFVGVDLATLTLDSVKKQEPVLVVRVDTLNDKATFEEYGNVFLHPRDALIAQTSGQTIYLGKSGLTAAGSQDFDGGIVTIHAIEEGRQFVDLVTSLTFLELKNGLAPMASNQLVIVGNYEEELHLRSENLLLFATVSAPSTRDFRELLLSSRADEFGSTLYLSEAITTQSVGHSSYNILAIVGFDSQLLMNDWMQDFERRSQFALATLENLMDYAIITLGRVVERRVVANETSPPSSVDNSTDSNP